VQTVSDRLWAAERPRDVDRPHVVEHVLFK